jgi:hypothetical protein
MRFQPGNRLMDSGPDGFGCVVCDVAGRMVYQISRLLANRKEMSNEMLTFLALPLPLSSFPGSSDWPV